MLTDQLVCMVIGGIIGIVCHKIKTYIEEKDMHK